MSSHENEDWSNEDLINFDISSNFLSVSSSHLSDSQNLLDSELTHLEEAINSVSSSSSRSRSNSKDSIELDQILISIDDNADLNTREVSVEDCLQDLDEYLQNFDTSSESNENSLKNEAISSKKYLNRSKSLQSKKNDLGFDENSSKRPCSADSNKYFSRNNFTRATFSYERPHSASLILDYENDNLKGTICDDSHLDNNCNLSQCFSSNFDNDFLFKAENSKVIFTDNCSNYDNSSEIHSFTHQDVKILPNKLKENECSRKIGKRPISFNLKNNNYDFKRNDVFRASFPANFCSNNSSNINRNFKLDENINQKIESSGSTISLNLDTRMEIIDTNLNTIISTNSSKDCDVNGSKEANLRYIENKNKDFPIEVKLEQISRLENNFINEVREIQNILGESSSSNHTIVPSNVKMETDYDADDLGENCSSNHPVENKLRKISQEMRNEESDEEIDWSWMQEIVPPEQPFSSTKPTTNVWLRSSMRRIRPFRLPTNPADASHPVLASTPVLLNVATVIPPPVVSCENVRVRSAPVVREFREPESLRSPSLTSSDDSLVESSGVSSRSCSPTRQNNNSMEETVASTPSNIRRQCEGVTTVQMPATTAASNHWPHSSSPMFAALSCTLGLFNISRFAILSVQFGANFIMQFLLLSLLFGMPLFTLNLCFGQQMSAGVMDMWRISPLFQGVGVGLLIAHALIGLYSVVGVSWMFVYFRDSFIAKMEVFKWGEVFQHYREADTKLSLNGTARIQETVPDYFNGIVLQRYNLTNGNSYGGIKFQLAFNLAVVWLIVFVSLSKGLRSYAKVVYVFTLLPIFGMFILCAKLLGMSPTDDIQELFPATSWSEFFVNSKSWVAASQETFLTWGLLGASIMQISSHNKNKHFLQRDSTLVIILTLTILLLTAFLANTCVEILETTGFKYLPSSFERITTYGFLRPSKDPLPPNLSSTPVRYMTHTSFIIGEKVVRPGMDKSAESGYQVLRFATELFPATLAVLGPSEVSPFWAVLFYFILILFGIAQQLAIWHCVITGIIAIKSKVLKSWETTITFFTCTFGFILGLPMTTEFGIFVVYFLDYVVGGTWWLILLYLLQTVAVFMIRGRPYSGDTVVTALFTSNSNSCFQSWFAPLLSFVWNVVLPVALMVVCVTQFKCGNFRELFVWHHAPTLEYWPIWARQIGSLIQLTPLLCVPLIAIIQSYRYLNNGPPDILDRIQLLYRPPLDSNHLDDLAIHQSATSVITTSTNTNNNSQNIPREDPPPKYTPPPSYTTATGARIAKLLRQSIRRSVRRLAHVLGETSVAQTPENPSTVTQIPPPDYSTVLVEMTNNSRGGNRTPESELVTLQQQQGSPLTAADVASILRSSFRRSTIRIRRSAPEELPSGSLSVECLVDGAAPIGEDSLVLETISSRTDHDSKGTPNNNRSSVI